ncbi:MAG TPA: transferase hexapeptide repeat family protein [Gammaproteobacteria bacterium]
MAKVYAIDGVVPVIDPSAFVHPDAVLIGDVIVGAGCYVGPGASLRGDMGRIELGAGSNVQDNCILHSYPSGSCVVEQDGHVGHGAILHGCRVERNALVGMHAVVMDRAVVGAESIVAALALVRAGFAVPPRTLVGGVPAKVMRELDDKDVAWKSQGTHEYQELARRSLATLRPATPLSAPEAERKAVHSGSYDPLHVSRAR